MSNWIKITEIENVPSMGSRIVMIGDYEIVLFKTKGDFIFAVNNECPHKQGKLSEGLVHEQMVTCPMHNWDIDLETGIAKDENNACTKKYETKIEEGVIYLAL
jgi:nitrite reductase (NADH) small subunit